MSWDEDDSDYYDTEPYTQCLLSHADGRRQVSWIPAQFAARGSVLRLKDRERWENGWQVLEVWGTLPAHLTGRCERLGKIEKRKK